MQIRAKVKVQSVTHYEPLSIPGHNEGIQVTMVPVYDHSIPEERRFHESTPSGKLEFYVTNPAVGEYLKPGRKFYLDFTPADEG